MMHKIYVFVLLLLSSVYILVLDYLSVSERSLQRGLIFPILLLLFLFYRVFSKKKQSFINRNNKYLLLFWGSVLIQMLVISTGGIQSPFLILIHLFMTVLSFVFSFVVSVAFLLLSFGGLFISLSSEQNIIQLLQKDPGAIIPQLVSLVSIIPIAYLVSTQYHMKDLLSKALKVKLKMNETIMSGLDELIIVTDSHLKVLSVNDSAGKILQRSRSEMLNSPIFEILFLKDKEGKLVSKGTFFPQGDLKLDPKKIDEEFVLMRSRISPKNVNVQVQALKTTEGKVGQISFIINYKNVSALKNLDDISSETEKARTKFEAMTQSLKTELANKKLSFFHSQLILLEYIENDLYHSQNLKKTEHQTPIDVAMLAKQIVTQKQDFAKIFGVKTNFKLKNFGQADIEALTIANHPVKPEQLTGPFFTILCDAENLELLIEKLFESTIILTSLTQTPGAEISVERGEQKSVSIQLSANYTSSDDDDKESILKKASIPGWSGLEEYIVKKSSEFLNILVIKTYDKARSRLIFTLNVGAKADSNSKQ